MSRRPSRLLTAGVLALAFGAAGTVGTLTAAKGAIETVERITVVDETLSDPTSGIENFLLIGSDSRADVDPSDPDYDATGGAGDVSGSRSDTIMVLHRDYATGQVSLLSIPRDLYVEIPGRGKNRINAAYNYGPEVLVQTVQQALGLPIHHYVEVDFSGFRSIVDTVGGVELCFEFPTRDTNSGLDVPKPGCHRLDGEQALAYARSRHYEELRNGRWREDGTADLGRMKRQRAFIGEAIGEAIDRLKSDPFLAGELIKKAGSSLRTDGQLDLMRTGGSLRNALGGGLTTYSLSVEGAMIDGKSVLRLLNDSDPVLAYFAGTAPAPPPNG